MAIITDTARAPADWACGICNGDTSGMEDADILSMDAWLDRMHARGWIVVGPVSDEEPFFGTWNGLGTDLHTYVLHAQPGWSLTPATGTLVKVST